MFVKITEDKRAFTLPDLLKNVKKSPYIEECGAIFSFEGIMRGLDNGKEIKKLRISVKDIEEAEKKLTSIMEDVKKEHNVKDIAVIHFLGEFYATETLFMAVVAGKHRKETRRALYDIIERVKKEVGFKKEEYTDEGSTIIMSGG